MKIPIFNVYSLIILNIGTHDIITVVKSTLLELCNLICFCFTLLDSELYSLTKGETHSTRLLAPGTTLLTYITKIYTL